MQLTDCKSFTYQTRFSVPAEDYLFLSKTAALLSKVERSLFADFSKGKKLFDLKTLYLIKYSITARQFNSCRISLEGKIQSILAGIEEKIPLLKTKIKKLEKHLKNCKASPKKHEKKHRLFLLKNKLKKLEKDRTEGKVRLCFGGKDLFHKQKHLEENGLTQAEWKKLWQEARNNQFFLVGSKDETCGNQSCQMVKEGNLFTLYVRLPNGFSEKILVIKGIDFAYGKEEIESALEENEKRRQLRLQKKPYAHLGRAISYRFLIDEKGWRVFVTVEKRAPAKKNKDKIGSIGIDINAQHIALTETDRNGNYISKKRIPCSTYGKSDDARLAIIGDAVKEIVEYAVKAEKPIVVEDLDFQRKKQSLRETSNKYSRQLSSFSYRKILTGIESKAFKEGIEIYQVNPAYTSIIGDTKFSKRYGLSKHHGAALVIARRKDNYSEKPPPYLYKDKKDSKSPFHKPERNSEKHYWSFYREMSKKKSGTCSAPTDQKIHNTVRQRKASVGYG